MQTIIEIFGQGEDLEPFQMAMRAIVISLICLLFIRFSGRRSFAMGTPFDNVLAILLGAVMGRAVVGASPFFSVVAAGATISILHRVMALCGLYSSRFGRLVKGEPKVVYENGAFNEANMAYCRVSKHDLMMGVRLSIHENTLDNVHKILVERNGRISVIMKTGHEKGREGNRG